MDLSFPNIPGYLFNQYFNSSIFAFPLLIPTCAHLQGLITVVNVNESIQKGREPPRNSFVNVNAGNHLLRIQIN